MGWSESNFACIVKSAKNTHRERIAYILSPLQVVLWPILCLNLSPLLLCQQKLVYSKRLSDNIQLANIETKTHYSVQKMWGHKSQLMAKSSTKISKLLLP